MPFNSFYRPQRSWAKVIFSQVCVKNSVHGGEGVCLSACWDTPSPEQPPPRSIHPPEQTPLQDQACPWSRHLPRTRPPGSSPPRDQTPPPPGSRLQHTVNERPVRILLECILFYVLNWQWRIQDFQRGVPTYSFRHFFLKTTILAPP